MLNLFVQLLGGVSAAIPNYYSLDFAVFDSTIRGEEVEALFVCLITSKACSIISSSPPSSISGKSTVGLSIFSLISKAFS